MRRGSVLDLLSALLRSGGFEALSRHSGLERTAVNDVAGVLVPELFDAMRMFVRRRGGGDAGVAALLGEFDRLGDGSLAEAMMAHDPVIPDAGRALLGMLYTDRAGLDVTIGRVAFESGQDRQMVERLAPYAVMLLAGYLSARTIGTDHGPFHDALAGRNAG